MSISCLYLYSDNKQIEIMITYQKPIFTENEIIIFERTIDKQIEKGNMQISLSTSFLSDEMQKFENYLGFYYPSGTFNKSGNIRNYRIAKNGKKYNKKENW